eukprot:Skav230407  [mRNA]  locus=scaffold4006:34970:36411:+ [translate_table: standard]
MTGTQVRDMTNYDLTGAEGADEWQTWNGGKIFGRQTPKCRAPDPPSLPGATDDINSLDPVTSSDGSSKQISPTLLHEEVKVCEEVRKAAEQIPDFLISRTICPDAICALQVFDDFSGSDDESVQVFKEYALDRRVQYSEGKAMADELKMLFFEVGKRSRALQSKPLQLQRAQASSCESDLVDAVFHGIAEGAELCCPRS